MGGKASERRENEKTKEDNGEDRKHIVDSVKHICNFDIYNMGDTSNHVF